MKSQVNAPGIGVRLGDAAPGRGSRRPARSRPRRAPRAPRSGTYLTAARISHLAPDRGPRRRSRSRTRSRFGAHPLAPSGPGSAQPRDAPAWRPVTPRSRRWEKNSDGSEQIVHRPTSCTALDAGALQLRRARSPSDPGCARAATSGRGRRTPRAPPRRPRSSTARLRDRSPRERPAAAELAQRAARPPRSRRRPAPASPRAASPPPRPRPPRSAGSRRSASPARFPRRGRLAVGPGSSSASSVASGDGDDPRCRGPGARSSAAQLELASIAARLR